VKHQSVKLDWLIPAEIQDPQTLVLGSFNPYESTTNSVDYYYGRTKNHFWETIAIIIGEDEKYFFENIDRKREIMNKRFCCPDVIESIDFKSENTDIIDTNLKMRYLLIT